jgi:cell division protein FtsB
MSLSNSDDIALAAARAATPPKSQLEVLAARVTELEARMKTLTEQNVRLAGLIEQLYKMQVSMVEEIRTRFTELVQATQQVPPPS